jgi:hypothetical protein
LDKIKLKDKNLNISAVKIQKIYRGYIYRLKHLPLILYVFQNYLKNKIVKLINKSKDGRINCILDEIIDLLEKNTKNILKDLNKEIGLRLLSKIIIKDYYQRLLSKIIILVGFLLILKHQNVLHLIILVIWLCVFIHIQMKN